MGEVITDPETETWIREWLNGATSPLGADLECTLDGTPTLFNHRSPTVRVQSPIFKFQIPDDNLFGVPIPAGSVYYADGFWVMLPPLPPGNHTLRFRAGTSQDVTYHLTVLPAP